jgi:hypothetical protein
VSRRPRTSTAASSSATPGAPRSGSLRHRTDC